MFAPRREPKSSRLPVASKTFSQLLPSEQLRDRVQTNRTTMSSSSNASIAKKARTKAEADFATWLMMAELDRFDDLPSNAQSFLTNYRTRLETMSEAESMASPFARSAALITARWEALEQRRNQRLGRQR
jgi:hypothetical protein